MPSNKTTAAAPIITGVFLAGTAAQEIVQHGLEIWTALVLVGGLSAVAVGLGVLTNFRGFDSEDDTDRNSNRTSVALTSLALTSVAVGAWIALT